MENDEPENTAHMAFVILNLVFSVFSVFSVVSVCTTRTKEL